MKLLNFIPKPLHLLAAHLLQASRPSKKLVVERGTAEFRGKASIESLNQLFHSKKSTK